MVCILLSSYNGEKYIREQIESILGQENVEVHIVVRDDGSEDKTQSILKEYELSGKLNVIHGKNIGWRKSFMRLLYESPDCEYYAFCDQDDIWLPQKLEKAIIKLKSMPVGSPNLYCSNLIYYKEGKKYGIVKKTPPVLSCEHALMRSLAAGCTMVFNKELRDTIVNHKPRRVSAHDFWTYQVASFLGNVYYDMDSYILYRQHNNNQIGASINAIDIWKSRLSNVKKNFMRDDRQFAAKELLRLYSGSLSHDKILRIKKVAFFDKDVFTRLSLCFDHLYSMGTFASDFWLRTRIMFGKI